MTTIEAPSKMQAPPSNPPTPRPAEPAEPATPADQSAELIRRLITDDNICILTFDRPNAQANLFDRDALLELRRHLTYVAANSTLKGLVLASAKKSIFIAGADIHALSGEATESDVRAIIELGQQVFNRLADLKIPTVAAIHGACVGGGYEICLACDYRIASNDKATKIGLPETMLGILPGWGGATRLPRLIGLPGALDIILAGKTLPAKLALKRGLVDALAPKEALLDAARARIRQAGSSLKSRRLSWTIRLVNSKPAVALIARMARRALLRKTRGHYPAVLRALDVLSQGLSRPFQDSLNLERDAVAELSQTNACRSLIQLFFLQERSKKLGGKPPPNAKPVQRAAVIGAGVMGAGIAQWTAARGIAVLLRDVNEAQVAKGMTAVHALFQDGLKRRKFTPVEARAGMDRLFPAPAEVSLQHTDVVIEAAVEKMELKKQLFARLDRLAGPDTILATNTSALSISEIAATTAHPERVVGIHFFNPVHRMQLVEVVVGRQTSPETTDRAVRFVQQLGKLPVVVQDRPGFLVNRILMPYLIEAGRLFEGGAQVDEIDEAMLEFGMPMGPLRLIDEVGVDVAQHVAHTLSIQFPDRFLCPDILHHMVQGGLLGRKTGSGFYVHPRDRKQTGPNLALHSFRRNRRYAALNREELRRRMVLLMVNESVRCLEERVVEAPEDVDFGMVMGTGFAPFRGGPLRHAEHEGLTEVVRAMDELAGAGESHFQPCARLRQMASNQETFFGNAERKGSRS